MTKSRRLAIILLIVAFAGAGAVLAQRRYSERRYSERRGVPNWTPNRQFSHDIFTFVRIQYSTGYGGGGYGGYGRGRGRGGGSWATDYPDSDLNFSYRLLIPAEFFAGPAELPVQLPEHRVDRHRFLAVHGYTFPVLHVHRNFYQSPVSIGRIGGNHREPAEHLPLLLRLAELPVCFCQQPVAVVVAVILRV